jgi:hypothetical protein
MAFAPSPGFQRAVTLIQRVCDIAAPRNYLANTRAYVADAGVVAAVQRHDTAFLYGWLLDLVSYQGISYKIARGYMDKHGRVQWADLANGVTAPNACPKLATYWAFHQCGYRKGARTCGEPALLESCVVNSLPMRNGRLSQSAAALFLFLRDVCGGDLVRWIDATITSAGETGVVEPSANGIIAALRNIHGVSDKVLSLALVSLLLGGRPGDQLWQTAAYRLVVVDTLVHNWLHRTGILDGFDARHAYGPKCYEANGCADIIQSCAEHIDSQRYGADNSSFFPRLIQSAIWRFCAANAFNICNGNRIDDRHACNGTGCPINYCCARVALRQEGHGSDGKRRSD